ncbi:hypothetical protein DPMN_099698 [Dreissena polymorpha]|uniref:Uncharacterized protein n=2 Tax=Dreissena polymorpha TaxID=45954 RepID=A0A9D4R6S6_DREPO|nr:hypothetical protein DPMN_099698 [Dreissena polymorpha]
MKVLLKALLEAKYRIVVDWELLRKNIGYGKEVLSLSNFRSANMSNESNNVSSESTIMDENQLTCADVEVDLLFWEELESYLGEIHDEQEKQVTDHSTAMDEEIASFQLPSPWEEDVLSQIDDLDVEVAYALAQQDIDNQNACIIFEEK